MKKCFEEIATEMLLEMAEALLNCKSTCPVVFHTAKYDVDVLITMKANKTEMTEFIIYNENGEDVTKKFTRFIECLKKRVPTYDEIEENLKKITANVLTRLQ